MSTLKVYVGSVTYNRKTKERHIEIITKEECDERERLRKERDNKIVAKIKREKELDKKVKKKKRRPRKGGMNGKWMKNVYGR